MVEEEKSKVRRGGLAAKGTSSARKPAKKSTKKDLSIDLQDFNIFKGLPKKLSVVQRSTYQKEHLVYLSCDPGIHNFAYVVFKVLLPSQFEEASPKELVGSLYDNLEIVSYGFLKSPLEELKQTNIIPKIITLMEDNAFLLKLSPDYLILERFQARGVTKGPANEIINYHIALLLSMFSPTGGSPHSLKAARLLIPAQWKRYYSLDKETSFLEQKYSELKEQPKELKKQLKVHHLDSLFLGIFLHLQTHYTSKKDLQDFKEELFKHSFFEKFQIKEY